MPSEEGGAGGREIVKLCIGCARGARSPRAREGGGARSRGALRAPRARGRARPARCARRPPGAPRAQRGRGASRSSAWRGRGRGAERAAALGGRTRGRQRGWESLARATERQHVTTAPNPARPGSCAFCVWERRPVATQELSFPHRDSEGWIARHEGGWSRSPNCSVPGWNNASFSLLGCN